MSSSANGGENFVKNFGKFWECKKIVIPQHFYINYSNSEPLLLWRVVFILPILNSFTFLPMQGVPQKQIIPGPNQYL